MPEVKLSDIEPGAQMAQAAISRIRMDYDWRNRWLSGAPGLGANGFNTTDGANNLDKAATLFEAFSNQNPDDGSIPRVNLIHKAVEDFLAVALTNIPKAHIKVDRFIGGQVEEWERPVRLHIIEQARKAMDSYVKSILGRNHYPDLIQRVVSHSAIFGVGYIYTGVDQSLDVRQDYVVRDIMNKDGDLTDEELTLLEVLSNRIELKVIDPRDVYWRHSVRDVRDEGMLRVSVVEQMDTSALRTMYKDSEYLKDPMLIRPGNLPFFFKNTAAEYQFSSNAGDTTTPVVTMYELEPVDMERVETIAGEEVTIPFTDWIMHKIVMAGNQLVEYQKWDSAEGPLKLPVVPIYLRKSVNHPYGWSLPLMLEKSEEYINAIQTIIFKSARRAVSTQGVAVSIPSLGETDLEELEHALEEGGVARIHGNNVQGPVDLREIIYPLNFAQSQINPALLQGMNLQMQMFSTQSQEVDSGAIGAARSGAGKRAQIAVADRPKTISINIMSEGIESVIDNLIELIRVYHQGMVTVFIDTADGSRDQVSLNEPYKRTLIVLDQTYESPENPLGARMVDFEATLNSTMINMWAESDGRSELPLDLVSRYQLGIALVQAGAIQPETLRELVLSTNEEIKAFDDAVIHEKKMEAAEQFMAAQQAQLAAAQQSQIPFGGQIGTTQIPADSFGGIAPQDIQAGIDTDASSPIASSSNPFSF